MIAKAMSALASGALLLITIGALSLTAPAATHRGSAPRRNQGLGSCSDKLKFVEAVIMRMSPYDCACEVTFLVRLGGDHEPCQQWTVTYPAHYDCDRGGAPGSNDRCKLIDRAPVEKQRFRCEIKGTVGPFHYQVKGIGLGTGCEADCVAEGSAVTIGFVDDYILIDC
ncbi:MAG: hypothetical protein U1E76_04020 [Planctomycetota bacterium]